jgi:alanine racemase
MSDVPGRPTVAEVSLSALRHNCRRVRELVGPAVAVMAVVKADAYGHGAAAEARAFLEAGAGVNAPLVVLGGVFPGEEATAVAHDLAAAVWSVDGGRALAGRARAEGRVARVHLKVNTGMTRLGVEVADVANVAAALTEIPGLELAGVFSHFASADAVDTASARAQIERFRAALAALAAAGRTPALVHLANSAAVITAPAAHFAVVRPGIMLYGYAPAPHLTATAGLRPALRFRTAVAQVRRVPAGTPVGYGGTFVTARPSAIAVVPVGYADGYHRLASNRAAVLVRGRRAPVAGRVCMDHTMIDVTDAGEVAPGDPVVLIGRQGEAEIGADELGGWCETISYEMLTAIGRRVRRVYVEDFDA